MTAYEKEREKLMESGNSTFRELCERRSVRAFEARDIGEEERRRILFAASEAPSAGCQQLYTVLDIRDGELKKKLSVSCDNQPFIARAPMVLVFCADCRKWLEGYVEAGCTPRRPGLGDLMLAVADSAIAAQNAVTAAWSMGIGSCYIGDILEQYETHRQLLELPEWVMPCVMVVFGYPTEQQRARTKPVRVELSHICAENTYPRRDGEELRAMFRNRCGDQDYDEWMRKFCARKYDSDFSREMTRSAEKYAEDFSER